MAEFLLIERCKCANLYDLDALYSKRGGEATEGIVNEAPTKNFNDIEFVEIEGNSGGEGGGGVQGGEGGGVEVGGGETETAVTNKLWFKVFATTVATALVKVPISLILLLVVLKHKLYIGYAVIGLYAIRIGATTSHVPPRV
ncbi:hypothetical protein Tco_0525331 [Tanacetum coccineum]